MLLNRTSRTRQTSAAFASVTVLVVALTWGGHAMAATHPTAAAAKKSGAVAVRSVTAAPGKTVTVATQGSLVLALSCAPIPSGALQADLLLSTTVDGASVDGSDDQAGSFKNTDLTVAGGPQEVDFDFSGEQDLANGSFSALTASGTTWTGYGFIGVYPGGADHCLAQVTTSG